MANLKQVLSNKRTIEQQREKQRQINDMTKPQGFSKRNLSYYDKLAINQSNKRLKG